MKKLVSSIYLLASILLLAAGANAQPNLLTAGDFEGISNPLGGYAQQVSPGVWGTENGSVTGAANGITPLGSQMLQINHSGGGTAAQTNQIVYGPFKAGSVVTFTVKFNSWLTSSSIAPFPLQAAVSIGNAFLDSSPLTDNRAGPAVGSPFVVIDTDKSTWQTATVTTILGSDTDYLAAELYVRMNSNGAALGTPLAYADDAVLTVVPPTNTAPVINVPANISVNATSAAGAVVNYSPSATTTQSIEIFRRHTATAEPWQARSVTFTSGVTGTFTLNFNVVSATGGDNSVFIDDVNVDGTSNLLSDGFEPPASGNVSQNVSTPATLGSNWYFNNYGGILRPPTGSAPWGSIANGTPPEGSQFAVIRDVLGVQTKMTSVGTISLVAGQTYTLSFFQASREIFGGTLTYTVTLDRAISVPVTALPASGSTFPVGTTAVSLSATSAGGTSTGTFYVTVNTIPVTITLGNLTQTYDGSTKSASATTSPSSVPVNLSYTGAQLPPVNAGSYGVLASVSVPYTGTATGTLTINPATANLTLSGLSYTYDGSAHAATVSVSPAGVATSITYNGSTTPPTNAGSYNVVATVTNPNYTGSATGTLVIAKANATVSVSGYTGTYDAAAHGATGTAKGVGGVTLGGLNLGATFTNVPGGTAHWTFTGGQNYNDQAGDVAIVINKADAVVNVTGYSGTYDGAAHGASGSAKGVNNVDLSAGLNLGLTFKNAPGGTASWSFAGGQNYNDQNGSVGIAIAKANATVVVNPYNVTYDAQPHSATVASIAGVAGETGATVGSVSLSTTHTDAGSYADSWSFTGGQNYNDIGATPITNTIAKANATVTVKGYTGTYDAAAHGASGTASGVGGVDLSAGLNLGASFTDFPGGTANWSFSGGNNYNDQTGSAAIVINKADALINIGSYTGTYDGAPHALTGTATGVGGVDLSSGLNFGASFTNFPGGTANWAFSGGINYNDAGGSAQVTINKAASVTTTLGAGPFTYNGSAYAGGSGTVTGAGGLSTAATSLTYAGNQIDAGTYTVTAHYAGDNNHTASDGAPVTITINKASSTTTTIGAGPFTYNGTAYAGGSGTVTGAGGLSTAATSLTYAGDQVNAGSYTVTANYAGDANHEPSTGAPVTITINKANAIINVSGYSGTYDGAAHGAAGTATGVGGASVGTFNLGATFTNAPGGTANWTFSGGQNYNDANGTAAIVISKANATVVVTPYSVGYDGLPHSATVASITGVAGETGATVGTVTLNTTHTAVGTYADSWTFTGATNYNNTSGTLTDKIVDTTAPVITAISTNAPTLWPPNHKMVAVTVSALASDLVGVTSLKIVSVTSSEPDNGLGDGDTANDIQVTGNLTVNLRAERSGRGNGRTYTITVEAKDAAGNASTRTVTVSVPKDQSDKDDDKKSEDKKGDDKKSEVKSENKKSDDKKDK